MKKAMREASQISRKKGTFNHIYDFPLVQIIAAIILINVPTFIFRSITEAILTLSSIQSEIFIESALFVVRIVTVYFMYLLYVRIFEKRKAEELQINIYAIRDLALGLLLALIIIVAVTSVLMILGYYSVSGVQQHAPVFRSFLIHSFYAFLQDLIYFIVIFRITEKWLGSWLAIIIASIIFGFKHLLFPGYTIWSAVIQSIEAGILFSALFLLTRKIWALFGFHLMWNFIQYGILGFPEFNQIQSLLQSEINGPDFITGKVVGLETSMITFVLLSACGICLLYQAWKKRNFIAPYWRRAYVK